ncbi:hypothetical protein ACM25O_13320 [Sulfitobacter pontiacus]
MSEKLTYTGAAKAMRGLGFRVSRNDDGEIRVGFPGNESAAYYTDCPADALATAQDMRKRADAGAVPVADPEGEAVEAGEHTAGEPWDGPAAFDAEPVAVGAEPVAVGGHLAPALIAAAAVWPNDCADFAARWGRIGVRASLCRAAWRKARGETFNTTKRKES